MAKRASILDVDYNPVGARLRSIAEPANDAPDSASPRADDSRQGSSAAVPQPEQTSLLRDERRVSRELKDAYLRFRCSESERKKWHDLSREITGEHNQLSHVL